LLQILNIDNLIRGASALDSLSSSCCRIFSGESYFGLSILFMILRFSSYKSIDLFLIVEAAFLFFDGLFFTDLLGDEGRLTFGGVLSISFISSSRCFSPCSNS